MIAYPDDCYDELLCDAAPAHTSPCDGDPATAPALDQCGVFVSAAGDDVAPGTKARPVRTLARAIERARLRGRTRVYACEDAFDEEVRLPSGIDLWGGRTCADGSWLFGGPDRLTTIAPKPVGVPLRVFEGSGTSMVFGVQLVAADASASDGKSSIAMIASDGAMVNVSSCRIHAGNGKDGERGEDAPAVNTQVGMPGIDATAAACSSDVVAGGAAVLNRCDDGSYSVGGAGGEGGVTRGGDGRPGEPASTTTSPDHGAGGRGASTGTCESGSDGQDGTPGPQGAGAVGKGSISVDGWRGIAGVPGGHGKPGQGGGGGGGNRGSGGCLAWMHQGGAAGGGGSAGGCGGRGGGAGGYGGASVGIVAIHARVWVDSTYFETGTGGHGGAGGRGQPGALHYWGGGSGGQAPPKNKMAIGCGGGTGGSGGDGGIGGGGLGGASIGIAFLGGDMRFINTTDMIGTAGRGGAGGNPSIDSARGQQGVHAFAEDMASPEAPEEPPR